MQESPNYVKFLAIHVSPDGEIDENIEVISTQYEVIDASKPSLRKHRKSILDDLKIFHDEAARKRLARGIMLIGSIFILLSGILLIVSLNMSKDIDEVVRNSNEFLRNKIHKSTPGPKQSIDITDYNTTLS